MKSWRHWISSLSQCHDSSTSPAISNRRSSLAPAAAKLVPEELLVLEQLLSDKWCVRAGLSHGRNGEITAQRPFRTGDDILPVGFVAAIEKLLTQHTATASQA